MCPYPLDFSLNFSITTIIVDLHKRVAAIEDGTKVNRRYRCWYRSYRWLLSVADVSVMYYANECNGLAPFFFQYCCIEVCLTLFVRRFKKKLLAYSFLFLHSFYPCSNKCDNFLRERNIRLRAFYDAFVIFILLILRESDERASMPGRSMLGVT